MFVFNISVQTVVFEIEFLILFRTVDGQVVPNQSEELVKIHKMLLETQQKLVKDESNVNSMLQKVTEMLKNQRNFSQPGTAVSNAGQSGSSVSTGKQSKVAISEASESKPSNDAGGKSPSEQSIPEEISRTAKSLSDEAKAESAERTANDYDNATFESDDSTPRSRRSLTSQHMTSQNGEANVEDEIFSLTGNDILYEICSHAVNLERVLECEGLMSFQSLELQLTGHFQFRLEKILENSASRIFTCVMDNVSFLRNV